MNIRQRYSPAITNLENFSNTILENFFKVAIKGADELQVLVTDNILTLQSADDYTLLLYIYSIEHCLLQETTNKIHQLESLDPSLENFELEKYKAKMAIYSQVSAVLLEEYACRKEGISRETYSQQATEENTAWLNSTDNNDMRFIKNKIYNHQNELLNNLVVAAEQQKNINKLKETINRIKISLFLNQPYTNEINFNTTLNLIKDLHSLIDNQKLVDINNTGLHDNNWITLEQISNALINIINNNTTEKIYEQNINNRKKKKEYDAQSEQSEHSENDDSQDEKESPLQKNIADELKDSAEFKKLPNTILNIITPKANEKRFTNACNNLNNFIEGKRNAEKGSYDYLLAKAGYGVLTNVKKVKNKHMVSAKDLPTLTKFVKGTTDLLEHPSSDYKMYTHANNINQVMKINRPWGKIIGGAMLAVLGTALVATSIVVAVATFGAAAPLSAVGLALGGSVIAAGVTVAAGLSVGVGLTVTAGMFANRARKGEMAIAGEKAIDNIMQYRDRTKKSK